MESFNNFFDFQKRFSNNDTCRAYLEHLRWDGKVICPFCKSEKHYSFKDGRTYKCAECLKKYNVLIGSIFENTKIELSKWFWAVYIASSHKKGISSAQLARDIDVQQKTAWFMLHRIRESLRTKGSVFTKTVEIDETFVGGKETNKHLSKRKKKTTGRSTQTKVPVLGILERGGEVYAEALPSLRSKTIYPIIEEKIAPGAEIMTDDFGGYVKLSGKYSHFVINHSEGSYGKGQIHTNTIEGFWSLLKRGIYGIYHFASPRHLNRYCGEFAFRYNTRGMNDTQRFNVTIARTFGKRLTYKWLTAKYNWE